MVSLSVPNKSATSNDGLRPVNLRTDLGQLADLIEVAFADSMDQNGRAAVREMRYLSKLGGLTQLMSMNSELVQGMGMGFVWISKGQLVSNVSIYPASLPAGASKAVGQAWLIANVATHPDFRGNGIARRLLEASLDSIRMRSKNKQAVALLQVERENTVARNLYEMIGFKTERVWTHWRRVALNRVLDRQGGTKANITNRRRGEWKAEYALAQKVRPLSQGGIGWLRPTFPGLFNKSLMTRINDFINLRSMENLVIRSQDERDVLAALWVESAVASSSTQLTLMTNPDYLGIHDEAMISYAVRRFGARNNLTIEHPADELTTNDLLSRYHFRTQRAFAHMRWED